MDVKMLDAKYHVDPDSECLCRYVKSETEYFRPHYHNYYELFLTMRGNARHIINGTQQKLTAGNLLFIRDFDVHDYACLPGGSFDFINLSFSKNTLQRLFDYLGEGYPAAALLTAKMPPAAMLTEREKDKLFFALSELTAQENKSRTKLKMRALLLHIFTTYFSNYSEQPANVPLWLEITYEKMKKPENFIAGTERLYALTGKSREHVCRCMKRHYGVTPSACVLELRLTHCANLLLSSNLSVTDICYECGFENISWFYKAFYNKFQTTPNKYRKIKEPASG